MKNQLVLGDLISLDDEGLIFYRVVACSQFNVWFVTEYETICKVAIWRVTKLIKRNNTKIYEVGTYGF